MAVTEFANLNLGKLAQILFSDGVRLQLSKNYKDFDFIKMMKGGDPNARDIRFMFQNSLGIGAVNWADAGAGAFPASQKITVAEYIALTKILDTTIKVDIEVWDRLKKASKKYAADILALEMMSKQVAIKRLIAGSIHGSGTGVVGQISAAAQSGTLLELSINHEYNKLGGIGLFEKGDKLQLTDITGATPRVAGTTAGTAENYVVSHKIRTPGGHKVYLEVYDSAGVLRSCNGIGGIVNTDIVFRYGQLTRPDCTSNASVGDYGSASQQMAGLDSLISADSRVVHGITMNSAIGSVVTDASDTVITTSHLRTCLDNILINVGQGEYKYSGALAAPETIGVFMDDKETDRRFHVVTDNARGSTKFVFVHNVGEIEMISSEFCHQKKVWIIPDARGGENSVLEFWFNDCQMVNPSGTGNGFQLEATGTAAGFNKAMVAYLSGRMTLINKRPGACGVITNFKHS